MADDRWTNHPVQNTASSNNADFMVTNEKDYSKFRYFLSGVDDTYQNLGSFTPYIRGYSRIFVYRLPVFMDKYFTDLTARFKSYLETGYRSINGIQDITAEFVDFTGGFSNQKFSVMSTSNDDMDSVTISVYEQAGSPVREFLTTWLTGIRDPRSGVAHYHGHVYNPANPDASDVLEYSEKNHSMELIYFTTDPTAHRIEYACLLAHCVPTKVPRDHLNYDSSSHDNVEMEIELKCTKYESRYINDIAAFYLAADTVKYNYLDFNPLHNDTDGSSLSYTEAQDLVKSSDTTFVNSDSNRMPADYYDSQNPWN